MTKTLNKSTIKIHEQSSTHEPSIITIPLWQKLLPPTFLSIITALFYYPSLTYPFQFDDLANITKKFDIRSLDTLNLFWTSRWLGELVNRLNYKMGMFNPFYFRATNVAVHIMAGILVYFLVYALCSHLKKSEFLQRHAFWIATITAALFLLHPMQTQTVSYIIQGRLEGLSGMLSLAALLSFFYGFTSSSILVRIITIPLVFVFGFLSCGAKEIVIVLPFLALLMDWFFIAEGDWTKIKSRIWFYALFSLMMFSVLVYYINPNYVKQILGLELTTLNNRGNVLTSNPDQIITPLHYLISEFKVVLHYLTIFLWPFAMSAEYDWKLSESFFSPDAFFPFLALLVIVGLSFYLITSTKNRFITFGLWWFFIAIGPRSSIIPSPELICDYKTYLASFGWLFILAVGIVIAVEKLIESSFFKSLTIRHSHAYVGLFLLSSLGLGTSSMMRNHVWRSSTEFWQDVIAKAPDKARAFNNLGVALSEEGKFADAIPHFLQAIRLDRMYSDPWSNIAVAYSTQNEDDKAIEALKQAIRIFPNYPEAYNNLGTLYLKKKEYEVCEQLFNTAIQLRPYYGKAFFNLGRMHLEKNNNEEAWNNFKKATLGDLDTPDGFMVLGQVSLQLKKYAEAIEAFEQIKRRGVSNQLIDFNLANAYFLTDKFEQAENVYAVLAREYPEDARYHHNLGESRFTQKKFEAALPCFIKAAEKSANFAQAHIRIAHCHEKLNDFTKAKQHLESVMTVFTDDHTKQMAQQEVLRLAAQEKIASGNGTFTGEELQKVLGNKVTVMNQDDVKKDEKNIKSGKIKKA